MPFPNYEYLYTGFPLVCFLLVVPLATLVRELFSSTKIIGTHDGV